MKTSGGGIVRKWEDFILKKKKIQCEDILKNKIFMASL